MGGGSGGGSGGGRGRGVAVTVEGGVTEGVDLAVHAEDLGSRHRSA
ncbi:MAG: hypothetical protein ACRD0N_03575 [Acidimicrobiales bacterium]